jgi:DNA-binding protein YbaB
MTDPNQIFAQYEGKLAEAQRKSEDIRTGLATLRVTERSPDGQISVSVNSSGNLVDIQLGASLQRREPQSVGQDILRAVQAAQNRVAGALREAMAPMMGGDSEAMDFMVSQVRSAQPPLPPAYVPGGGGYVAPEHRSAFDTRSDDDAPPPPVPPRSQPRPRPDDDEDFGGREFLR